MPSGLLTDHGCALLRQHLFDRCTVDAIIGFDNRDALFPIHRGMRFSLVTATAGGSTSELQSRPAVRSAAVLDDVPDEGEVPDSVRVPLTLVRRFSGPGLAVPELPHERDRAILARVLAGAPPLGSGEGWKARFGRELNATDDRQHFGSAGLPVLEGKLIDPFVARAGEATEFIDPAVAARLLGHRGRIGRARLGYREVAASTNRLTLIAAMIPARAVTTHTIFCMREPADELVHWFLCGVFNSFVANYPSGCAAARMCRRRSSTSCLCQGRLESLFSRSRICHATPRRVRCTRTHAPNCTLASHALTDWTTTISSTCSARFRSSPPTSARPRSRRFEVYDEI
jgi:hypothetical protein